MAEAQEFLPKSESKTKKYSWLVWILAVGIIFIVIYRMVIWCEKAAMEQYLNNQYGKEFIVEDIDYSIAYLGGPLEYKGVAYAVDDKDLKFDIAKRVDNKPYVLIGAPPAGYRESYLTHYWGKQARGMLSTLFDAAIVEPNIYVVPGPIDIKTDTKGRTLNLKEAVELLNNQLIVNIWCGIYSNSEGIDSEQIQKIYDGCLQLKNENYKLFKITILYFNEEYKRQIDQEPDKYLYVNLYVRPGYNSELYNKLKSEDILLKEIDINIKDINQPEDILKYI